jgi:hypothetical protein
VILFVLVCVSNPRVDCLIPGCWPVCKALFHSSLAEGGCCLQHCRPSVCPNDERTSGCVVCRAKLCWSLLVHNERSLLSRRSPNAELLKMQNAAPSNAATTRPMAANVSLKAGHRRPAPPAHESSLEPASKKRKGAREHPPPPQVCHTYLCESRLFPLAGVCGFYCSYSPTSYTPCSVCDALLFLIVQLELQQVYSLG